MSTGGGIVLALQTHLRKMVGFLTVSEYILRQEMEQLLAIHTRGVCFTRYFVTGNPFCPFNSNGCGNDFDMTGFGWKNTDAISYSVQVFPSVSDFSFSFNDPSRSESIGWKGCGTYESGRFNSPLGELQEGTTSTGLGSQEMALESLYAQVDNSTLQQKAYAAAFAYSSSGIAGAKTFFESTNLVDQGFAYGTHYAAGHRFWSSTATSGLLNFGANLC